MLLVPVGGRLSHLRFRHGKALGLRPGHTRVLFGRLTSPLSRLPRLPLFLHLRRGRGGDHGRLLAPKPQFGLDLA